MFPSRALCFISSPSRTPQFPLDPILLFSLRLLSSCTCLPLRRICSLVYIFRVLVLYYLRTNITYFSLVSVWGSSERSDPPARLRASPVSSVLVLVPPARVLVWTVNSCPLDSSSRPPLVRPDPVRSERNTKDLPLGVCSLRRTYHLLQEELKEVLVISSD